MARKASSGPDGDAARGQGAEPGNLDVGPPPRRLQAAASTLAERQARCRGADPKSPLPCRWICWKMDGDGGKLGIETEKEIPHA